MRRTAQDTLDSLGLPDCGDVFEFAAALSHHRGRRLHLLPVTLGPSDPCGLWLSTAESDFITYEVAASRHHQHHIIAHELGHMIYGHRGTSASGAETSRLLFPDLDPTLVQDLLSRSGHTERQEREAEVMATTIRDTLRRNRTRLRHPTPVEETLVRIRRSLM